MHLLSPLDPLSNVVPLPDRGDHRLRFVLLQLQTVAILLHANARLLRRIQKRVQREIVVSQEYVDRFEPGADVVNHQIDQGPCQILLVVRADWQHAVITKRFQDRRVLGR